MTRVQPKLALATTVLLGLGLMAVVAPEAGATHPNCTVGPSGEFADIQSAVDVVGCATVTVAAGVYTTAVKITRPVVLTGEPGAVIRPDGTSLLDGGVREAAVYITGTAGVTVQGFEIDGTAAAVHFGVFSTFSGNTVQNNQIHDITNSLAAPVNGNGGFGIFFHAATGVPINDAVIKGNAIADTARGGIQVGAQAALSPPDPPLFLVATGHRIIGNSVARSWLGPSNAESGGGIEILGAKASFIVGNRVFETGTGLDRAGIFLAGSALGLVSNTVTGNDVHHNQKGIFIKGSNTLIDFGTDAPGPPEVHFNRVFANTDFGLRGLDEALTLTVAAENNWFGCNGGPGAPGCDTVSDTVSVRSTPWLTLGAAASPTAVSTGGTSSVGASLRTNSSGTDTSSSGTVPDGIGAGFAATLGTMAPPSSPTVSGISSSVFTASTPGTAVVSSTIDAQTVATTIVISAAPPPTTTSPPTTTPPTTGPPVAPPPIGSPTFYFAEGTTLDGFREYLLLANPSSSAASATITYFFDDGSTPLPTSVSIPASGRTTIDVVTVVGPGRTGVSVGVSASGPVVAERSVYFSRDFPNGPVNGSHSVLGARSPRSSWLFAEGSTLSGFQEYLTLQNPGGSGAEATIVFGIEGGGSRSVGITVPAGQRRTVDVNAALGAGVVGHSTRVTSNLDILVERPMYFTRAVGDDAVVINGGHVAFGSSPAPEWNFAEGTLLPGFSTYLTLGNPDPGQPAVATIVYFFTDGTQATRSTTVAPGSRRTVRVFDLGDPAGVGRDVSDPLGRGVSMRVSTASPGGLVAERPTYFHHQFSSDGPEINDGHDKPGAPALSTGWAFAEGSTLPGFFPFLTILNASSTPATLTVTYTTDQGPPVVRTLTAAATSRLTVQVYGPVGQGGIGGEVTGFGIVVSASLPVLVERPLYVDRVLPGLPEINGGSDVIGLPA